MQQMLKADDIFSTKVVVKKVKLMIILLLLSNNTLFVSDKSCSCLTVVLLFNEFYNLSGLFIIIKLFTKKE